jgi:predicted ATP-dependent serine protease
MLWPKKPRIYIECHNCGVVLTIFFCYSCGKTLEDDTGNCNKCGNVRSLVSFVCAMTLQSAIYKSSDEILHDLWI